MSCWGRVKGYGLQVMGYRLWVMGYGLQIAWRYLFAKKDFNAINIVSGVSAVAVGVVTAAMICVMSVLNGFGKVVQDMFSQFDPDLKVVPAEGKYFSWSEAEREAIRACGYFEEVCEVVEETALVRYGDQQLPARLMGVDDRFQELTHIDSIITDGYYSIYDGAFERAVMGRGLAAQLGMNAHFVGGMHLYAPKREGRVNMLRPEQSLQQGVVFIAGTFAVNQVKYDDEVMIVSLPLARELFGYDSASVTSLQMKLASGVRTEQAKQQLHAILGERVRIMDRYEQQEDFFRIVRIEKLLTTLLLVFILLIACFNCIGSLSMLIIDKQNDIRILSDLGANLHQIRRIFLYEGWLISALGAVGGLVIGLGLCLLQEHFGWLKLGNGSDYVLSAYPVSVVGTDVLIVMAAVLALGWFAAWIPSRHIRLNTSDEA